MTQPREIATDITVIEIDCGTGTEIPDGRLVTRTRERHATVQQLVSNFDDALGPPG